MKARYISFILLRVVISCRFSQQSVIQSRHDTSPLNASEGIAKKMDIFLHWQIYIIPPIKIDSSSLVI